MGSKSGTRKGCPVGAKLLRGFMGLKSCAPLKDCGTCSMGTGWDILPDGERMPWSQI